MDREFAEYLQKRFQGRIESGWGTPFEKNMRVALIDLPRDPKDSQIKAAITDFYKEKGFREMDIDSPLTFEGPEGEHRYAAFTYIRGEQLNMGHKNKLIVTGASF